jgi:hypothetical protein
LTYLSRRLLGGFFMGVRRVSAKIAHTRIKGDTVMPATLSALILLTAILGAGCASQATNPKTASSTGQLATTDAQRLTIARNLNLKVVDKDGQQLFCRSNLVTGSHLQRDTTCYTADQLDKMQAQQQRDLDQLQLRSAAGGIRNP